MLKNYIKVALRNLIRNLGFSIINVLGLAIGIACSVIIFLFVNFELSFDRFHEKSDRIYRIGVEALIGNTEIHQLGTPALAAKALYDEYPEIEAVCRFRAGRSYTVKYEEKEFLEQKIFLTDSTFFDMFSFSFFKGNPKTALSSPKQVVMTESCAERYFGNEEALGKIISVNDTLAFTVSGIIEDVPDNSHYHFDILFSIISFEGVYNNPGWTANNFQTYLLLKENSQFKELEKKLPDFIDKYIFSEFDYSTWAESGNKWEWFLQPLRKIHLTSDLSQEFEANGNISYVYIFSIVALFILLIACINFMNLTTAKGTRRAMEVGVRKIVGSTKGQLRFQFLGESILLSLLALIIGMFIVESIMPLYRNFIGQQGLKIHYFDNIYVIPSLLGLALLVGIISGSYPAIYLSSFRPLMIIKSKSGAGSKNSWLRNFLVIFQFSISIALIIGSLIVYKQVNLLKNENLGFNKENILIINNLNTLENKIDPFKQILLQHPGIKNVSTSSGIPGDDISNIGFGAEEVEQSFTLFMHTCDNDFDDVMELEMVKGRFFSDEYPTDTAGIVINESALKLCGYENPIGKHFNNGAEPRGNFTVIGVVKDYHYQSKHQSIRPMALFNNDGYWNVWGVYYMSVRYDTDKLTEVLDYVKNTWNEISPQFPHNITFLAEDYDNIYQNEEQTNKLLFIFSLLSIFIACLGLLGLASFMAEQRTKEIGVRKVLGASVIQMLLKLSKDFTKWVLVANLIAIPTAWFVMNKWLENFPYKVKIDWWIYLLAGIIALLIAILTVSLQAYKAARINPVDSLKHE
ncbi:ABC transporter permease [Bacteroidota bacterium]